MRSSIVAAMSLSLGITLSLVVPQLANAQPAIPRKAPELTVAPPSGKTTLLSSYKGKVVVLALVYTTCPHCQKECEVLTQIYKEMAPQGVQMLAVAFNDNAAALVPAFVQEHGVTFPVGTAGPDTILNFLNFSVMERYTVPQMAVIDRKGMIRAQTSPLGDTQGDAKLRDPGMLKELITTLLKEGGSTTTSKAAPKTSSNLH